MHRTPLKWAAAAALAASMLAAPAALAADPENVVYSAEFEDGKIVSSGASTLGKDAFGRAEITPKDVKESIPTPQGNIQPELLDLLAKGDPRKPVDVVITYPSSIVMPELPMPVLDEDRSSPRNQALLKTTQGIIGDLKARRTGEYKKQVAQVESLGGKVLDTYWLIQGVRASVPLDAVKRLAASAQYVELADAVAKPPADANPNNDMDDARAQIFSDPYFNLGQTSGWIGLLDTGVRTTHVLFNSPDHIAIADDLTGDGDPSDQCGHGTSSAAEITGNARLGNAWRGVSAISVDSWDIYGDDCLVGSAHAVAGFQEAVSWLDKVIVAEIQLSGSEASATSTAADSAFNSGSVVISANGNFGPGAGSVRSPGNAHKSIGIGAADLQTDALMSYSGRGPATDGRYKPDLVFPTNVETADNTSNTAQQVFTGTSAATPIAGGAAALLRNWMRGGTGSIDAGHVYSHLILGGQTTWPFNNNTGAGPFQLGTGGVAWWGKTAVGNGGRVDIPINVSAGKTRFEGALWWPEGGSSHNDIDLELISPSGVVRASSVSGVSVFERASVTSGLTAGTWKLRLKGFSVSGAPTVYWSARVR